MVGKTEGDGGVDRDLGNVALDAEVVVVGRILLQTAARTLHIGCHLERAQERLSHASHSLRVG